MKGGIMSQFNIITDDLMSEEEARTIASTAFGIDSETASAEHDMLVDSTQLLALGGISVLQVLGSAQGRARKENNYDIGRTFDIFTTTDLQYGQHVSEVTKIIKSSSIVTRALVYAGRYSKARKQLQINSELLTDGNGRQYFEVLRRYHFVTAGVFSPWSGLERKNGAQRKLKLFVKDRAAQQFYTLKNGKRVPVALGVTSVYDDLQNRIYATGVVDRYVELLNGMDQAFVESICEDQQALFLNVFKAIKAESPAAATESQE